MDQGFNPPKQRRSEHTLEKLLSSTLKLLVDEGFDAATVPRISAAARVAPATVYRRFKDKDALLRAAFVRLLEQSRRATKAHFNKEAFRDKNLCEALALVIHSILSQYQSVPRLLVAMKRFTETRNEDALESLATGVFTENLRHIVDCLKECPGAADDPRFEMRAEFGLLAATSAIELRALEPSSLWRICEDRTGEEIESELVTMLTGYLRPQTN